MWNNYELPHTAIIGGVEYEIRSDYREILDIFSVFNDSELPETYKITCAMQIFYPKFDEIEDIETAANTMLLFINANEEELSNGKRNEKPLMDWEKDIGLVIPPINRILQCEVREIKYMHWWTFLGAFMEIGECTFNTYVSIRDKNNRGEKLDKAEQRIYKENRDKIDIKKKIDAETQALLDEVMGR